LVRKICEKCKKEIKLSEEQAKRLREMLGGQLKELPENFWRGQGCKNCNHTGYRGRVVIAEILVADDDIRAPILTKATSSEIKKIAIKKGMTTMLLDGVLKASEGLTTIEEVLRVTHE